MKTDGVTARAAALALALLWVAGCAGPSVRRASLDGWQTVETKGVRIFGDVSPAELDALAQDLSGFHAAFSYLIGREIASTGPTTIALIRDPVLAGRIGLGQGVGGFAWATFDGAFACVLLQPSRVETRQTLLHEYTHLLLWRHRSARIARWYTEGLAEYFSTVAFRDGALVVGALPASRLAWLAQQRRPMPLDLLFGGDRETTLRGKATYDFYATAWALTHYLLASPKGRGELSRFEKELAKGTPLDAAREAAFGRSFERLTEELTTHIGYLSRGVAAENVLDPRKVRVTQPSPATPMRRSEVAGALGAIALTLTDDSEEEEQDRYASLARAFLEVAVDEDGANARALAALARARTLGGDPHGAEEVVASALRDAPADPQVQLDAGYVALAADDVAEAEARFRSAIALDERSPMAWFGLGRALVRAGQADSALAAFERARSLGWSGELDLELGRLHLAAQRAPEARALLQPLASDPHGGHVAEQAAELLEELDSADR
jgi:Flp pilus assembly protein TadD